MLAAGTLLFVVVQSGADEPRAGVRGPQILPPDYGSADSIHVAILAALHAYGRDDIVTARSWLALASRQLAGIERARSAPAPYRFSNAGQLIDVLQLYRLYAAGRRPELDAQYEKLLTRLAQIAWLNRDSERPDHLGAERVEYHLITHLVTRIGDVPVDYHLITQQITRVGDLSVDYHLNTRMPTRIGGIEFEYDLIDGRVTRVAGVDVR
jgi:hypothetical protein